MARYGNEAFHRMIDKIIYEEGKKALDELKEKDPQKYETIVKKYGYDQLVKAKGKQIYDKMIWDEIERKVL